MSARTSIVRRWMASAGGATAAEFALALPVFVVMVLGLFEFGWTQHCLSSTRYALERAGRDLMLNPNLTEAELQARVRAELASLGDPNVSVSLTVTQGAAGRIGTLAATYVREIGIPMLPTFPVNYTVRVQTSLSV